MKRNDCSIVQDLLPLYIEEMLQPDTAEYVEDHLSGCEICTAALSDLKSETAAPTPAAEETRKGDQQALKGLRKTLTLRNIIFVFAVLITTLHFFQWSPLRAVHQEGGNDIMLHYLFLFTWPAMLPSVYFVFFKNPSRLYGKLLALALCIPLVFVAIFPMLGGLRKLFYFHMDQTIKTLLPAYWVFLICALIYVSLTTLFIFSRTIKRK